MEELTIARDRRTQLFGVIGHLYDAATDMEKWPAFLSSLTECFGGNGAQLGHIDEEHTCLTFSIVHGKDAYILERYREDAGDTLEQAFPRFVDHFSSIMHTDPRITMMQKYPNRPFACRDLVDEQVFHDSQFYAEIAGPGDVEYSVLVMVPAEGGGETGLGVFRGKQDPPFSPEDVQDFGMVVSHLRRALELQRKFAVLSFEKNIGLETLGSMPVGIVLVDEKGKIRRINAAARHITTPADGISMRDGGLVFHDPLVRTSIFETVADLFARHALAMSCRAKWWQSIGRRDCPPIHF